MPGFMREECHVPATSAPSQDSEGPQSTQTEISRPVPSTVKWVHCQLPQRAPLTTKPFVYYASNGEDCGVLSDLVTLLKKLGFYCTERSEACRMVEGQAVCPPHTQETPVPVLYLDETVAIYISVYEFSKEGEKERHCSDVQHLRTIAQNEKRKCRFVCVHIAAEHEVPALSLCQVVHEVSTKTGVQAMEVRMPGQGNGAPQIQAAQLAALVCEVVTPQKDEVVAYQGGIRKVLRPEGCDFGSVLMY